MSSQWVFWLCGYIRSSVLMICFSRTPNICYALRNELHVETQSPPVYGRSVCVCVWTSIQKQASAHARTHMNMCEHYYLFSLFQKPKIVVSISFIFLGMHKNAHVLPIILTLYSLVLLLLFWPKVWVVLRLRFSCPWLCNKIWMFFSCCHAFIPNFMYSDFFFVMTSKYSVLFFHVFRSCSVSVVVFFSCSNLPIEAYDTSKESNCCDDLTPQTVWSCGDRLLLSIR